VSPLVPRLRRRILLLLFAAITINILDRQVLSLVAPVLRERFHLSDTQYGVIVFFFLLGMAMGQVPVGSLLDRIGARKGLTLIFAWWTGANFAHAFVRTVFGFGAMRFLLGIGECGNYSAGVKVIGQWFPPKDRALAAGFFNGGSLAGAILAPPLVTFLILHYGWQSAFLLPSAAGALWLLPWLKTYWEPWRHPALPEEARAAALEQSTAAAGPQPATGTLLTKGAVWGVILMRAFPAPVGHFYWYWLPEYLRHGRGMSLEAIGLTAWLPFLAGGVGNIGGGWISSVLIGRGWSVDATRKVLFTASTVLCLLVVLVPLVASPGAALALISAASLAINAYAANLMGLLTDLFPQSMLARVSGLTGVGDNVMSMLAMLLTGMVVDRFSYTPVFVAAAIMPAIGLTAFYGLVRVVRPLVFKV
jgi:ACS family hexuronate transporter-like MFS transporter